MSRTVKYTGRFNNLRLTCCWLQDCYRLMCLTAPEVAQYDDGIQTLQRETAARKAVAREKEEELSEQDLPIFHQIQAIFRFYCREF